MTPAWLQRAPRMLAPLLALLSVGCASLGEAPPAPPVALASAPEALATAPTAVSVDIQAEPRELRQLLRAHLDLARVTELARADALDATEWARLMAATPAQVRSLLETEGYFDPRTEVTRGSEHSPGAAAVVVKVQPGPRSGVAQVDLIVQGPLERSADSGDARAQQLITRLRQGWELPAGRPFRNPKWTEAKAAYLAQLRAAGYASAAWAGTSAEVDTQTRQVRLFAVAESGPLFRSGALRIEGLQRHDERTVHNLAQFQPGTPVTESLLLDFKDRLRQSGLFDGVVVRFDPDASAAEAVPIVVQLRESARQIWTVGAGISANTGPRASLEHLDRRPFGWPAIARNKLEWGRLRQAWDGEISSHPQPRLYRNLVGGAAERLEGDDDVVTALRLRLGRAKATARVDRLFYVEAERSERRNLTPTHVLPDSLETALTFNAHAIWRRVDSIILPTRGATLALQGAFGLANGSPGDRGLFARAYARLTAYHPFGRDWFGQASLELGQVFRPDGVPVPDSLQFRAGGDDSVRGYAYRSLGPLIDGAVDSGDALLTASVELARPIWPDLPELWGAVFVDAGRAAASFDGLKPAVGLGVGARYRSPVGPLRLDLAWGEETRKLRLHFSVGIAF